MLKTPATGSDDADAPAAERPGKLASLEAGRGLAAVAVVLSHCGLKTDAFTYPLHGALLQWGVFGVDFFFVLSGFIIYFVHHRDPPGIQSARRFLGKRLKRIFIPYLPIGIGMGLVYTFLPTLSHGEHAWDWLSTLTLLPFGTGPALSVAWTLVFEMTFYLTFLTFFFVRRFAALMWAWAIGVVLLNGLSFIGPSAPELVAHLFNYLILEFLAGMAMAYLFVSDRVPDWRIGVAVSGLLLAIFIALPNTHRVLFGLALAPLVLLIADWERRKRPELPKAAVVIGAASYAIYLVHDPAIAVAARAFFFVHSWSAMFALLALVGVTTGVFYHFGFEKRALRVASRGTVGSRLQRHGVA